MVNLTFDKANKLIILDAPQTTLLVQDLANAIRDYESDIKNFDIPKIASTSGKDDLGGVSTGITLRLHNGWRVTAEPRAGPDFVRVDIRGGNIVTTEALGANPNDPIAPAAFVTISLTLSVSATLQTIEVIKTVGGRSLDR
jgi:hypothetical protein